MPNTRYAFRRKNSICARFAVGIFVICFGLSQLYVLNQSIWTNYYREHIWLIKHSILAEKNSNAVVELNYSAAAILSMVPSIYHKYLTTKTRNQSYGIVNDFLKERKTTVFLTVNALLFQLLMGHHLLDLLTHIVDQIRSKCNGLYKDTMNCNRSSMKTSSVHWKTILCWLWFRFTRELIIYDI